MVGDFCPFALLGGEKVSAGRALSCPLGKESQAAAFRTSREGKRNSSWCLKNVMLLHLPWLQSTLISTAVCVLVTAGTDQLVPLAAEVTARAKVTNRWRHSAKPSSPAPTQTLCSTSDLNNVFLFPPSFFKYVYRRRDERALELLVPLGSLPVGQNAAQPAVHQPGPAARRGALRGEGPAEQNLLKTHRTAPLPTGTWWRAVRSLCWAKNTPGVILQRNYAGEK